jgi:hypothetical protein
MVLSEQARKVFEALQSDPDNNVIHSTIYIVLNCVCAADVCGLFPQEPSVGLGVARDVYLYRVQWRAQRPWSSY